MEMKKLSKRFPLVLRVTAIVMTLLFVSSAVFAGGKEEEMPAAVESEYGGRLQVGFVEPIDHISLDSTLMWAHWGLLYYYLVYDTFAHYSLPQEQKIMDPHPIMQGIERGWYSWSPRIVKSYEVSDDRKVLTMHIVENAKFHDGRPVTAEDLKFSLDHLLTANVDWQDPEYTVEKVEVIDQHTLRVYNAQPIAGTHNPNWWRWDPIIPKHAYESYKDALPEYPNEQPVGSGPFKLKEFAPGEFMWLVANEDYWNGRPYLDEVVFRYFGSMDTMVLALKKGEIDTFGGVELPVHSLKTVENDPNIKVEEVEGLTLKWLTFNLHKKGPLQDKMIRHAVLYGIDRERIIDLVFLGYADKYDSWIYEDDPNHHPSLPQYDYDPSMSKKIMDNAGYRDTDGDGVRNNPATGENLAFELLVTSEYAAGIKMAQLIKENLADVGIGIEVKTADYDTFWSLVYYPIEDGYEIAISEEEPSPSPYSDWVWLEAQGWDAGGEEWNSSYWDNDTFNELTEKLTSVANMQERRDILYEMQELMADELPYAPLVRPRYISVYRTDKFEGWINFIGGPVSWLNNFSILNLRLKK
jgi:peptide/nickel transport system substrate-binding protein